MKEEVGVSEHILLANAVGIIDCVDISLSCSC